jgi:Fe-S cluster biogenesis protein NfuA
MMLYFSLLFFWLFLILYFKHFHPTQLLSRFASVGLVIGITLGFIPLVSAETDCNAVTCDAKGENCERVSLMPVEQCETLLALYDNTDGPNWKNKKDWHTNNEPRDFANVVTDDKGNVIALNLYNNRLSGPLPDLSALTSLEELNLYQNKLTSFLPDLSKLTHLKKVNLRNNRLTGPIPDLSALINLENMSLYANQLCGPIPDLSALKRLKQLDLSQNELTGPIPPLRNEDLIISISGNQLCRDSTQSYSGFEFDVEQYPICSEEAEYPVCTGPEKVLSQVLTISQDGTGSGSVTADGIDCGSDCREEYPENTEVTLTAASAEESSFAGWGGACSGTTETCVVLMTEAQAVTATFNVKGSDYSLTVSKDGSGTGSVTGAGIDCGSDCSEQYPENTVVILTATPADKSTFVGWNGACSGTASCQITLSDAQNVTATFDLISTPTQYTLTVNRAGSGTGTVTGEGIDCGPDCSEQYPENTEVILTATPAAESIFLGWSGACEGAGSCQITLTEVQNVTATFDLISTITQYTLTVNQAGSGTGTVTGEGIDCGADCSEAYFENSEISLTATPAADALFVGWGGACSGSESCIVRMTEAQNVTATFDLILPVTAYPLTLTKDGSGTGTVTGDGIDCGGLCSGQYVENQQVTLTATPVADAIFAGWTGACSGTKTICQVIMNQAQTVTATFNLVPPTPKPDLEFLGLKPAYHVGELIKVDLVEHLQTAPRAARIDLWVAIEDADHVFHYMTDLPLEPFSSKAQAYRHGIAGNELVDIDLIYHLLYFDVPPGINGTYNFYAIYNQAEADLSNLMFTQQSTLAFATTVFQGNINPPILTTLPASLTMLVDEQLELVIDSEKTLDAILSTCTISPVAIVNSYSAISSDNNGISCYLKALKAGNATLTTTDKNGKISETSITVR